MLSSAMLVSMNKVVGPKKKQRRVPRFSAASRKEGIGSVAFDSALSFERRAIAN
jgi:hypothetical protein